MFQTILVDVYVGECTHMRHSDIVPHNILVITCRLFYLGCATSLDACTLDYQPDVSRGRHAYVVSCNMLSRVRASYGEPVVYMGGQVWSNTRSMHVTFSEYVDAQTGE